MDSAKKVLVTGAGGFIGHHLVTRLKDSGHWVRGVDIKHPEFTESDADEFLLLDLTDPQSAVTACTGIDEVYALAADMGGMGYISANHSKILRQNFLINVHTIDAAARERREPISLYIVCVHLPGVPPGDHGCHAAEGSRRLPGPASGRLRVGEADRRATVHLLRATISGSRRAPFGSTTSSARWAHGTAGARSLRPRCAERSRPPS